MTTLAEAIPIEQARVRELLKHYHSIGPIGVFGAAMLERAMANMDRALASGDIVEMLRAYEALKECE